MPCCPPRPRWQSPVPHAAGSEACRQRFDSQLADLAQPDGRAGSDRIKYYNYPPYAMPAFKKLADNARRFQMLMGMSLQEFEFLLVKVERLCPEEERKRLSKRPQWLSRMKHSIILAQYPEAQSPSFHNLKSFRQFDTRHTVPLSWNNICCAGTSYRRPSDQPRMAVWRPLPLKLRIMSLACSYTSWADPCPSRGRSPPARRRSQMQPVTG